MITRAVEVEFDTFLASNADLTLPDGRQRVVRHGHDPVRTIQTGIGPVKVQKTKARDRMEPQAECDARGQERVDRLPDGHAGGRAELEGIALDLKARGLSIAPEVAVGDGALGFWKAVDEMFPATRHQRCWLHKTLNVLDKFPKSVQPNAHKDLREIWLAPDLATAETAIAAFAEKYAPKYDKAVEC